MNEQEKLIRLMTGGVLKMLLLKWGILLALNFIYRKLR